MDQTSFNFLIKFKKNFVEVCYDIIHAYRFESSCNMISQ